MVCCLQHERLLLRVSWLLGSKNSWWHWTQSFSRCSIKNACIVLPSLPTCAWRHFFARHDWSKLQSSLKPCQHLNGHLSENACLLCIWWKKSFPNDRRWASNQRQLSPKYLFPPLNQLLLQNRVPINENVLDKRGICHFNKVSLTKVRYDFYLLLLG